MKNNEMISLLFQERTKFIVIGLTGRTGSGCTTAAQCLETGLTNLPEPGHVTQNGQALLNNLDIRRYKILKSYSESNSVAFYSIKVSDLISAYLLKLDMTSASKFIALSMKDIEQEKVRSALENAGFSKIEFREKFREMLEHFLDHRLENV